ncbi:MAG: hypothetical protein US39_C0006G0047 [Microgenomates group bacterium GW2011_GWC1_37_12b]|uniref:Uncharacterized protein n=1 Tax=Candidatus Woesebacteria bacterium GW2011_GWB1_38_8b TaxID=1618571 RepID=A0A0G0L8T9_9BACT|nr:MAG: hypothetical protein US39_C0006G0047 [Microgenomates group bacterium GW2011_GWC1_37_12b]KKQ87417.1 MAG: hypothetical protein UT10_C0007G0075 [Candidatus Woesebacteria bacterium GW2011_GWB1_38_8b]
MRMDVSVKTRKEKTNVIKKGFGNYEVWVKAPPYKGMANKEVISVLANYFSVKPYNLRIVKGLTSSLKVVELRS